MRRYIVVLVPEPAEGGYSVTVPALPGLFTQGETKDEAPAAARETIASTSNVWPTRASRSRMTTWSSTTPPWQ